MNNRKAYMLLIEGHDPCVYFAETAAKARAAGCQTLRELWRIPWRVSAAKLVVLRAARFDVVADRAERGRGYSPLNVIEILEDA